MEKKTKVKFNIIAIVSILIFCFAISPIALQNDTFYTIKIGEYILEHGIHMEQDPFSIHTIPYTYPHWLYDVGIYLIYSIAGMNGIYLSTVILCMILGITIYLTNQKIVKNELISFLLTIGVLTVLRPFIAARAQLVTFVLFALTIYFIEKFLETKKVKYAISLVIIPILIANIHLAVWPFYFVLFLPYIGEYLIWLVADSYCIYKLNIKIRVNKIKRLSKTTGNEEKIAKLEGQVQKLKEKMARAKEKAEKRRKTPYKIKMQKIDAVKWLIIIVIICLFTGLFTPLKDTPYTYLIKTMQGNTTKNINEHLPMVLANNTHALSIIVILMAMLIFTDTKIRLKDLFMLGGLTLLAIMSKRQLSMLVLIGVYSLNTMLCDFIDKYDKTGVEQMIKAITRVTGMIITILLVMVVSLTVFREKVNNKYISKRSYPVEAVEWIKENLNIAEIRLYNEYNYGSYILFQDIPVFIDSRADLYTPEFNGDKEKDIFTDFLNTASINVHYNTTFDKYDITHLLIPKNAKINLFLKDDEDYKELYKDDNFIIYERLEP